MENKYNILIVEDHALTSFALKTSISGLEFVGEIFVSQNALEAYKILDENNVDLIIMDIGLPEIDGVQATIEIRKTNKEVKIVILTSHCDKEEVLACLNAGISAYCTKDIKPDKLSSVIYDVLNGSMYFDSAVSQFVMEQTSNQSSKNSVDEDVSIRDCYNLTQQEKRVLLLLSSGLSNQQIAKKLDLSVNTIKVHVCSVLQKMNVDDRTQAAIKAIKENLIV